jgi:hypothetical protein
LELAETTRHFAELSEPKGTANKAVHLTWDGAHVVALVAKPHPESPIEPSVALEFELDGTKESAALHQTRARQLLSDTRNAKARLTAIHVHSALHGELRQRKCGALEWTTEALTVNPTISSNIRRAPLAADLIERINLTLLNRLLDVALDFGPFGNFFASGVDEIQTPVSALRIQSQLRARVEWLCKASGSFVTRQRQPVGMLDDQALIHHFSQLVVPPGLLSHKRALESVLRNPFTHESRP